MNAKYVVFTFLLVAALAIGCGQSTASAPNPPTDGANAKVAAAPATPGDDKAATETKTVADKAGKESAAVDAKADAGPAEKPAETAPQAAPSTTENPEANAMTEIQKVSYSLGAQWGNGLKKAKVEIDLPQLIQGLQDALGGKPTLLSETEMKQVMIEFQQSMMLKRQEEQKRQIEENKAEQKTFLEENAKKDGVTSLPSGLQYKVIKSGQGKTPTAADTVKVNYRGTLPDGTEFDSSEKRGGVSEFQTGRVIAGWTEALQLMKEGDKWQLFVPAELAYKDAGRPGIPPAKMLIFEVELIEVVPASVAGEPAKPGTVVIPNQPAAVPPQGK